MASCHGWLTGIPLRPRDARPGGCFMRAAPLPAPPLFLEPLPLPFGLPFALLRAWSSRIASVAICETFKKFQRNSDLSVSLGSAQASMTLRLRRLATSWIVASRDFRKKAGHLAGYLCYAKTWKPNRAINQCWNL